MHLHLIILTIKKCELLCTYIQLSRYLNVAVNNLENLFSWRRSPNASPLFYVSLLQCRGRGTEQAVLTSFWWLKRSRSSYLAGWARAKPRSTVLAVASWVVYLDAQANLWVVLSTDIFLPRMIRDSLCMQDGGVFGDPGSYFRHPMERLTTARSLS